MAVAVTTAVAACVLAACGATGTPALPPPVVKIPAGKLAGFSTPGFPQNLSTFQDAEKAASVHANIASWYTPLGMDFNAAAVTRIRSLGVLPVIEIDSDSTPLKDIANGGWDSFFTNYARAVASYRSTIAIDFDHEFNGKWSAWGYPHTTAATFVAAWRRIVTIFRENHATNVIWIWNPNITAGDTVPMAPWYPGNQYVTWVGLDGYFFSPRDTFDSVFARTLDELNSFTNKKVLIVETGAQPGVNRVAQIDSLFKGLEATPRIIGFIWFDRDKGAGHDWLLDDDDDDKAALAAFHDGVTAYRN